MTTTPLLEDRPEPPHSLLAMALPRYSAPLLPPTHTIPYLTRVLHDHPIDYGVNNEKPTVYISSGGVKLPPSGAHEHSPTVVTAV